MSVVYTITHSATGRSYVGRTDRVPGRRWYEHVREAKRGGARPICRALKKYGPEAFEWRAVWDGPESRSRLVEQLLIRNGLGHFNLTAGGEGILGVQHTEQTRRKMSASARSRGQRPPPNVGTEAARKVHLGAKRSAEWRENMKRAQRARSGRPNETDAERAHRKCVEARAYYRANRDRILKRLADKRGATCGNC